MFRKLRESDYSVFHTLINEFRKTTFSEEQFLLTLSNIQKSGDIWVYQEIDGSLVAVATIYYEYKFIFNTCVLAHIEDVCVSESQRGKGYGKKLMNKLYEEARAHGCYKITLDCADHNVGFYEACRLTKRGNQMCELIENLFTKEA